MSQEIGGQYHDGNWRRGDKMQFQFQDWTMTLDTYTVSSNNSSTTYTRLRAPYVNAENFRFAIYRKSIFSGIGKWLGMQDIEIGAEPFDDEFIIKSNNEDRVREFFADETIRALGDRGYRLEPHGFEFGDVQVITRDADSWIPASDPRDRGDSRVIRH